MTAKGGAAEPRLALDRKALAAYLAGNLGPARKDTIEVNQFSGGQSNPTYAVRWGGRDLVLRRKPSGALLPSAHAINREFRVMSALATAGYPVPKPLAYCDDISVIGSEFYLMARVEGRVLFDTALPEMPLARRRAIYEALLDRLADLHRLDYQALGLSDFGRQGGYVSRQTRRWSEQYRASETETVAEMDMLIDRLPDAVAGLADETTLVHGDYRLDNVMLYPEADRVVAVLDWELSTLGHPLADLSYFLMTWLFPNDLRFGLANLDLAALGIPTLEELAARYARRTGRDALGHLDVLLAYNIFRLAAILQGVYSRGLHGNAASQEAALSMGADVRRLARIAVRYLP